jgi:dsRNA-specific ribonuclease
VLHNQREIGRSIDSHDVQLAVSVRLLVQRTNNLAEAVRALTAALPPMAQDKVPQTEVLVYEKVGAVFEEFNRFRDRNDYLTHMREWFMGEDVSNLGPDTEPEPELKNEDEAPEENPQDPTFVFGGDYNASEEGRAVGQPEGRAEADDVPTVQADDPASDTPKDAQGGPAVS